MISIEFMGPIGIDEMRVEAKRLQELKEILSEKEELKNWLDICAVAINDEIVSSLEAELKDGDKVTILPPVCGG